MAAVTITASNPNDIFLRDWNVFTTDPSGKYIGGGQWVGGITPIRYAEFWPPSATWTIDLPSGAYYFIIGQSGGTAYGTYSGIINDVPFSGNDLTNATQFIVNGTPPPSNGGTPVIPTTIWIAIGAISIVAVIGAIWYFKRKR